MKTENTQIHASCPFCSSALKFRDTSYVEKSFQCPECQGPIRLVQGLENFYEVVIDDNSSADEDELPFAIATKKTVPRVTEKSEHKSEKPSRKNVWGEKLSRVFIVLKSPVGIAWSIALGGLAIFLWATLSDSNEKKTERIATNGKVDPATTNSKVSPVENKPLIAPKPIVKFPLVAPKPALKRNPAENIVATKKEKASPRLPLMAPLPRSAVPEIVVPMQQYGPEDFEKAFAQKIKRFEQAESVPARLLFDELEEMVGIPIRFDPPELADTGSILDRKMKLELQETNVREILNAILKDLNLELKTDEKGILIVEKKGK